LPPDIETLIFNKCDNPPPSTPFGVLKNFYNNGVIPVKMLGSDFKAVLESTRKEVEHAEVYEALRKLTDACNTDLRFVLDYGKLNELIKDYPKTIDTDVRYAKTKGYITAMKAEMAKSEKNRNFIVDLLESMRESNPRPRYIQKDGSDDNSADRFVDEAVQLVLSERKVLNLKINDKDQNIILPGPRDIRLYIVDKISFAEASKEVTANAYNTTRDLPKYSFPPREKEKETDTPFQTLDRLFGNVKKELHKVDDESASDNCIVTLSMRCIEGYIGDWRGAVVSIADLKDALCEYVKRGLVFEACEQICKDRLGLTHSRETLRKAFEAVDVDKNGYLEPHEFYLMLLKLFKMGMTFEQLYSLMTQLGLKIQRDALLRTFQMMDIDQDGSLGTAEFITGIETLLSTVIPMTVLEKTDLTPPQIILAVSVALFILLLIFVFIFLSMSAFTGPAASSAGIQSVLMAGSAFIVKSHNDPPDIEKLRRRIKDLINEVMGIDKKQATQAEKNQKNSDGK